MDKEKSEKSEELSHYPKAYKLLLDFARERGLLDEDKKGKREPQVDNEKLLLEEIERAFAKFAAWCPHRSEQTCLFYKCELLFCPVLKKKLG